MTRSLAEVARLGMRLGADFATFAGLAGIGDLIATCTSVHSRNRRAGELIGHGEDRRTGPGDRSARSSRASLPPTRCTT